jgi:hypothetical protein
MIADHADKIVAARLKGQRPADMVLIFLNAPLKTNNPYVVARPGIAYDWRWVRGLDLCLYVTDADDWGALAKDIAMQRPGYLGIWNHEAKWGATIWLIPTADDVTRAVRQWRYEIDFTVWMDFQNADFLGCVRYARDEYGIPYKI